MPEVTELLERLADRPPCDPTPLADLRARAHHRRRRRQRATMGSLGLCLVIAAIVVNTSRSGDGSADDVRTQATTEPTLDAANGLAISPATGLQDSQEVTLSLVDDPGGEVTVTQCAAEWLDHRDDPAASWWCGDVHPLRSTAGRPDLVFPVARLLDTPNGPVDCAAAPGRCLLYAGNDWPGSRRHGTELRRMAPLVFADDLGPPPEPVLRLVGVDGPVTDGQKVRVEGEGFGAGVSVVVTQCAQAAEATPPCDAARPIATTTGPDGTFAVDVLVFHDITSAEGYPLVWRRCEPCVLSAHGSRPDPTSVPIELAPTADPIHPSLRLVPDGPYSPGQVVRLDGEGFQANDDEAIGWCRAGQSIACSFPDAAFTRTDDEGRLTIDAFPLPGDDALSTSCAAAPGVCVLGWAPAYEGAPLGFEVPLDLSG